MTQTLIFNIKRGQSNIILCMQSIQHKSNRIGKNNTESQLKSTTTNKNPSICMAVPCSNYWVDCFLFLWTEFLIVCIDASCNLHDTRNHFGTECACVWMQVCVWIHVCLCSCTHDFVYMEKRASEETWPSAMITKTWYCPPLFSTISMAASTTGA